MTFHPAPPPVANTSLPAAEGRPTALWLALGALLVLAVIVSGSPHLHAPWIQGDEYAFIADNDDVTGHGQTEPAPLRWLLIFTHRHEDLYQPLPMLTYAIEWQLWGDNRVGFMRLTDVGLHALNGLLLWLTLRAVLGLLSGAPASPVLTLLSYALAFVWTLHPVHVSAYAADMGRTHLLSACFALLSLQAHVRYLQQRQNAWFAWSFLLLILAMMSKPVVGWFVLIFVLEWHVLGLRKALLSPRVYLVALLGVAFAWLTLRTTREAEMLEDYAELLFGDPLSRSCYATWLYARNTLFPAYLATWYVPDPRSSWGHAEDWIGLGLAAGSIAVMLRSLWRTSTRGIALGLVWFWALLFPVIGIIGARVASANDRYLYQPLMGVMLVVGIALLRWLGPANSPHARRRATFVTAAALAVGISAIPWDRWLCANARTTLKRAERLVALSPLHPRAWEVLAIAYEFSATHDTPERKAQGADALWSSARNVLDQTAAVGDQHTEFFATSHDRAAFERRMAYRYLLYQDPVRSLEHAQRAFELEPSSRSTWTRLAHAYRALERWSDAVSAYQRLEVLMLPDDPWRSKRLAEYGNVLLQRLDRPAEAIGKLRAALDAPGLEGAERVTVRLDLALAEIRGGQGAVGFQLVGAVLRADPTNVQAALILAEYHLLSHHWEQAGKVYDALLRDDPTNYAALRGFQEWGLQTGRRNDAALAWAGALHKEPNRREFKSWLAWSLALAGGDSAPSVARSLLESDPNNPMACFALMLDAIRRGNEAEAVDWVRRARAGEPIPKSLAFERAGSALKFMVAAGELPPEAVIARAAVYLVGDFAPSARSDAAALLEEFLRATPESPWKDLAGRLHGQLSDHESSP